MLEHAGEESSNYTQEYTSVWQQQREKIVFDPIQVQAHGPIYSLQFVGRFLFLLV